MSRWRVIVALAAVAFASSTFAADQDEIIVPGKAEPAAVASSAGGALNSMSLLAAAGLAATGGWMVWRNRRGKSPGRDSRLLAVDETRPLGNRQYLVVASYEGKKFLLGVCPGRIDMLSPLDGGAARARDTARE